MKRESIHELKLENVDFSYDEKRFLFKKFSFTFTKDHPIFIQGEMGSGKHTLFKILLGLHSAQNGKYIINSKEVQGLDDKKFNHYRLNMGYAFESNGLINNKSLLENLLLPLEYHGHLEYSERREYILSFFKLFNIDRFIHFRPSFVSVSVRKVVNLIRAFVMDPEILFLDRPTENLPHQYVDPLFDLILKHHQDKNLKYLISISNDDHFASKLGGKIYQLNQSNLILKNHNFQKVS